MEGGLRREGYCLYARGRIGIPRMAGPSPNDVMSNLTRERILKKCKTGRSPGFRRLRQLLCLANGRLSTTPNDGPVRLTKFGTQDWDYRFGSDWAFRRIPTQQSPIEIDGPSLQYSSTARALHQGRA